MGVAEAANQAKVGVGSAVYVGRDGSGVAKYESRAEQEEINPATRKRVKNLKRENIMLI